MADAIAAGDIVRLKSGGPEMTVLDVDEAAAVCVFFDKAGKETRTAIKVIALKSSPRTEFSSLHRLVPLGRCRQHTLERCSLPPCVGFGFGYGFLVLHGETHS